MKPYYEDDAVTIYHGDCRELMPSLDADAIITDPPYFRVKGEAWDRAWNDAEEFLLWLGSCADGWRDALRPHGSLMVFASPQMCSRVESVVGERFNVLNVIRWYKEAGWHQKARKEDLRSFMTPWEGIVFAEQFGDEYEDASVALHKKVYAPIGRVVATKRINAGLERWEIDVACAPSKKPTGLCYRWEEGACLPTIEQFVSLCRVCGDSREYEDLRREYEDLRREYEDLRREYEDLRREYEDLRREYEDLRRPFTLTPDSQWSDLWRFRTAQPTTWKHPCEKPVALLEHAVMSTTRAGGIVVDGFAGSGSTLLAARNLGRKAIGIEIEERYCEIAAQRCSQGVLDFGGAA